MGKVNAEDKGKRQEETFLERFKIKVHQQKTDEIKTQHPANISLMVEMEEELNTNRRHYWQ